MHHPLEGNGREAMLFPENVHIMIPKYTSVGIEAQREVKFTPAEQKKLRMEIFNKPSEASHIITAKRKYEPSGLFVVALKDIQPTSKLPLLKVKTDMPI